MLDPHSSANVPIPLWSWGLPGAPTQVLEAVGNQIHLLPGVQDVCSFLPEKKPSLGCELNTEHDQKAKGVSKRDNANRDNSFTDQ